MKPVRLMVASFIVIAVALGVAWMTVVAQGPVNNSPGTAFYIDNQLHSIPASTSQWYKFNYGGGGSLATVTLVGGANSGLRFNVFTSEQAADFTNAKPVGRGTVLSLNCNSGLPTPQGGCQGNDLVWIGKFRSGDTIFVELINDNPQTSNFILTVAGEDVAQCVPAGQNVAANANAPVCPAATQTQNQPAGGTPQATAVLTLSPTITATRTVSTTATISPTTSISPTTTISPTRQISPTATITSTTNPAATPSTPTANNNQGNDPDHAIASTSQAQTVPANSSLWYRFEYGGGGSEITAVLPNGVSSKLGFEVFTPTQIAEGWLNSSPVGQGTPRQGCSNNQGGCSSDDLFWRGSFKMNGTYYVRVTNLNPYPVQFTLNITS
ncbi:MAG TPA: hypothetical protein VFD70_23295 [Anaerolineae bacterium]|nr:hypothetical protein [Anaerolineae bacterium]